MLVIHLSVTHLPVTHCFVQDQIVASHTCLVDTWNRQLLSHFTNVKYVFWLEMNYRHTCDTIYTHFWGITDNIYDCRRPVFAPSYFYPSKTGFTCPNDGWTGLCIKLCCHLTSSHLIFSPDMSSTYLLSYYLLSTYLFSSSQFTSCQHAYCQHSRQLIYS